MGFIVSSGGAAHGGGAHGGDGCAPVQSGARGGCGGRFVFIFCHFGRQEGSVGGLSDRSSLGGGDER